MVVKTLKESGAVKDNMCRNSKFHVPVWFKVAVAVHHLAYGGTFYQTAGHSGLASSTVRSYVYEVCKGIFLALRPFFMRAPLREEALESQKRFAMRRGILNVGLAVDGTHVPWAPDDADWMEEFHNYKGWYSVLCVAVVNSFYMFVDAEVGHPGRASDSHVTSISSFWEDIQANVEEWLGPNGMLISDGAFGLSDIVLTPYPRHAGMTGKRRWFNFCFSSTRIYVEQIFGMWKNRWRIVLKESDISRPFLSLVIYATMVLHNICVSYGIAGYALDSNDTLDETTLLQIMKDFPPDTCKKCREAKKLHCRHKNRSVIAASSDNPTMIKRRDEIADALWDAHYKEKGYYPEVASDDDDDLDFM
jgi:hypothetical protein